MKALNSRGCKDKDVFRGIWQAGEEPRDNVRNQKSWQRDLM